MSTSSAGWQVSATSHNTSTAAQAFCCSVDCGSHSMYKSIALGVYILRWLAGQSSSCHRCNARLCVHLELPAAHIAVKCQMFAVLQWCHGEWCCQKKMCQESRLLQYAPQMCFQCLESPHRLACLCSHNTKMPGSMYPHTPCSVNTAGIESAGAIKRGCGLITDMPVQRHVTLCAYD